MILLFLVTGDFDFFVVYDVELELVNGFFVVYFCGCGMSPFCDFVVPEFFFGILSIEESCFVFFVLLPDFIVDDDGFFWGGSLCVGGLCVSELFSLCWGENFVIDFFTI